MLTFKQRKAVRLMFQTSEEDVARELGVRVETISSWWKIPEFREALAAEARVIRSTAARIASEASLAAAKNLYKILSEGKDGKLLLDTLKASGAFDAVVESPEESLEEIVRQVAGDGSGN